MQKRRGSGREGASGWLGRRTEVIVKMQKSRGWSGRGGGVLSGAGLGGRGQGGRERRIEVIVMQNKKTGVGVSGWM